MQTWRWIGPYYRCWKWPPLAAGSQASAGAEVCHRLVDAVLCQPFPHMVCKANFKTHRSSQALAGVQGTFPAWRPNNSPVGSNLESLGAIFFSMNPGQFACSQSYVTRAVWAGTPSCWKMKSEGRRRNLRSVQAADDQHSSRRWLWSPLPRTAAYSCRPNTLQPTPPGAAQTFHVQQSDGQGGRQPIVATSSIYSKSLSTSKSASSSQHQKSSLFTATLVLPEKTTFEMLKTRNNFSKVVQQHYVGEVDKSMTFVLHIIPAYSVPNDVEIGQYM